MKTICRR